jgi:hypothetical protein
MKWIAATIAPFHRVLLVLSSVALGIVGSRVATDPTELPSWALVVSAGSLLFVADLARNVDEKGRTIAVSTRSPISVARRDVTNAGEARAIFFSALLVVLSAIASVVLAARGVV